MNPYTLHLVRHGFVARTLSYASEARRAAEYARERRAGKYRPIMCRGAECDWCVAGRRLA